ncbi:hypothetical protein [Zooshikella sp. RANM57]|uniref:hypothetical protein n=1 Tax=Zooshikella sp. RANM57 TaxID=3425863 RepID=UPI003D6FD90E
MNNSFTQFNNFDCLKDLNLTAEKFVENDGSLDKFLSDRNLYGLIFEAKQLLLQPSAFQEFCYELYTARRGQYLIVKHLHSRDLIVLSSLSGESLRFTQVIDALSRLGIVHNSLSSL